MVSYLKKYLNTNAEAAPLAVFRIFFGLLMCLSLIRFWYHGWIEKLYLEPTFHFHYYGFSWIEVPPAPVLYGFFIICGLAALSFAAGFKYRLSIIIFFLTFTYIELLDKTTYLNHYYFVSVISFILIWLPAHRYFSVDAYRNPMLANQYIPNWTIDIIKLMLAIVYIYAGIAKLNADWLLHAMPLTIWLPTKFDVPLLGELMHQKWLHFAFSWAGAFYDLFIVFFLCFKRTRLIAFVIVIIFHLLTRVLFPIGMFPYIMIISTLIFFEAGFHKSIIRFLVKCFRLDWLKINNEQALSFANNKFNQISFGILSFFMIVQLLLPWRFLLYPGNLFWTEEGYRFSWRVMLMEKTAYANFKIVDGQSGKRFYVQNEDFLTAFQQKQMATQPDFIVEYAHYLGEHFSSQGHQNVEVYVESFAALNGRKSQAYINPNTNLMTVKNNLKNRTYILPLNE